MDELQTLAPGTTVYSSAAEPIGTIQSSDNAYFFVEEGVQIPLAAISMSRDGEVHLSVTKADVFDQRWTQHPAVQVSPDQAVEAGSDYTAVQGEDSLKEDPMPTPGQKPALAAPAHPAGGGGSLERPSGMTSPINDGRA